MIYKEIIAVCSQIHTKLVNVLAGRDGRVSDFNLSVHVATSGLSVNTWQTRSSIEQLLQLYVLCTRLDIQ